MQETKNTLVVQPSELDKIYRGGKVSPDVRSTFSTSLEKGLSGEGVTIDQYMETNKRLKKTADFIELSTGASIDDVNIPFSDNILPALEQLLAKSRKPMLMSVKNGWPDQLVEPPINMKSSKKR